MRTILFQLRCQRERNNRGAIKLTLSEVAVYRHRGHVERGIERRARACPEKRDDLIENCLSHR
jgi:hypothetical protein